ncbi:MAG TPA: hypothetical protein PKZ76_05445 [Xanthomonadaceae bacterium]|nr:hypothetical protein [Xanthomonadaceae bacterium]
MKRFVLVLALAFGSASPVFGDGTSREIPDEAIMAAQLTGLLAPIRNEAELAAHLDIHLGQGSPLDAFEREDRTAFIEGLSFGPSALGSLRYDVFGGMRALDAFRILGLFGWQDFVTEVPGLRVADEVDRAIREGAAARFDSPEEAAVAGRLLRHIAPIRNEAELQAHLAAHLGKDSPLDALDPAARADFLASMSFDASGLAGFREESFEGLAVLEAYKVLGLFGWQHHATGIDGLRVVDDIDRFVRKGGPFRNQECDEPDTNDEA